jgi:hypothetical protein
MVGAVAIANAGCDWLTTWTGRSADLVRLTVASAAGISAFTFLAWYIGVRELRQAIAGVRMALSRRTVGAASAPRAARRKPASNRSEWNQR